MTAPAGARLASRTRLSLLAALAIGFVALRCVHLSADAPVRMYDRPTRELFAEPPAKAHEARNWALFGSFKINPADDYQFWRAQSPVWVYPLAGFFRAFGTNYPQLRLFSTLYSALGLVLLLVMASPYLRTATWSFVGLALVLDPLYFHTSRVGFIEPAVATWVTLAMLASLKAERELRWLIVAHLAWLLAFFTKQAAVYALPVVAFATIALGRRAYRAGAGERRKLWIVVGAACAMSAAGAVYIAMSDYWRAVAHNFQHIVMGYEAPPSRRLRGLESLLARFWDVERYQQFFSALPATGLVAVATLVYFLVRAARARRLPPYHELVLFGWFACTLIAMQTIAWPQLRFWTVVVPAAAIVAGLGIDWARRALQARRAPTDRGPLGLPLIVLVAWSTVGHLEYFRDAEYTVRDGARTLEEHIGPRDATIVGFSSPGIVLGTRYRNFYVRGRFNATRQGLLDLGITHFLFRERWVDHTRVVIQRSVPELLRVPPELVLKVRREKLKLFDVEDEARRLTVRSRAPARASSGWSHAQ